MLPLIVSRRGTSPASPSSTFPSGTWKRTVSGRAALRPSHRLGPAGSGQPGGAASCRVLSCQVPEGVSQCGTGVGHRHSLEACVSSPQFKYITKVNEGRTVFTAALSPLGICFMMRSAVGSRSPECRALVPRSVSGQQSLGPSCPNQGCRWEMDSVSETLLIRIMGCCQSWRQNKHP